MMQTIIGIDPGFKGGISAIQGDKLLFVKKMPTKRKGIKFKIDGQAIKELLKDLNTNTTKLYIERVHSFPLQGVASMFTFGEGYGKILGVFEALEIEYEEVLPRVWQKVMYEGYEDPNKYTGAQIVKKIFPEADIQPGKMMRYHDGMTDAIMIALYGGTKEWSQN